MSDAFSEIVAVLMSILLGFPLAVTAAQILWINLVSDGLPHLALAVDPKRKNIMSSNPRSPKEPLVNLNMKLLIGFVSVIGGLLAFALFYFVYQIEGLELARSVAFAVLGTNSLIYVFSIKTLKDPVWRQNPFDNLWLIGAVVVGFVAQVLPFIYLPLGKFLDAVPIPLTYWFYIIAVSVVVFLCIEMSKFVFRNNKRW